MTWARALRALLRVEWRQIRRNPGRSLLILTLIAVPVAAIVGGSGLVRVTQPNAEQQAARVLGRGDLRVEGIERWDDLQRALGTLPAGSVTARGFTGLERLSIPGSRLRVRLLALEPGALEPGALESAAQGREPAGLADGIALIKEGRAPENAGEVALSPTLLEGLGREIGQRVHLEYGGARTITGVVVEPEALDAPLIVRVPAAAEHPAQPFLLVKLPDSLARGPALSEIAGALRREGFDVLTRDEAAVTDEAVTALIFTLGILGLFEAGLVVSAAFGVSLQRRQVEIGLLGATGATAEGLTRSLLVAASLLAALGGALGTLLGALGLAALYPFLDGWTGRISGPLELSPGHILGAVALGVLAALLAALPPARRAARMPVRQALAGRRPSRRRSRGWLLAGALLLTAGLLFLTLSGREETVLRASGVLLGPIFSILGFGACAPWLLDRIAERGARLPLAWRLAVRDAGRFRERNGAVVTAVLAGMAMSVTMAALVASLEGTMDAFPANFRDDQLLVEGPGAQEVAATLAERPAVLAAAPLKAVYLHGEPVRAAVPGESRRRRGWIATGDESLLRALGAEGARQAFREGALLALDPTTDSADALDLSSWVRETPVIAPPVHRVATGQTVREPAYLLAEGALQELGLESGPPPRGTLVPWILRLEQPVTAAQLELARAEAAASVRTSVDAELLHGTKFRAFYYAVLLVCALTGLVIVITATALSAAESAADERVLHTVGASPSLLRSHQAARAGYLAFLGCSLAIPAGLLAAGALFGAVNFPLDFTVPWRDLMVVGALLPALVYAGAFAASSRLSA
ncbi:MAG: FtsX-like permease family protein, partial [Acidobacteriota bacterium]